jgi:two-component system nitrate/nitrite response regulator NarL
MNGLEAAHLIKQQNPETKVIILSLYNQQHLIAKAKTLGVSRYMTKDQPMEEIVQTIISVCEGTKEH